jgi:AcrR family transcriptional regulator
MPPRKRAPNRLGVARREQILDAAVELFAQRGYRGGGLLELADRVGMTHGGILHHFGTKEELLRAVMARRDQIHGELANEFRSQAASRANVQGLPYAAEPPALTRLATVLRAENLDPGDPLHEYFVQANRMSCTQIADDIRARQERGQIRSDIDADLKAVEIQAFNIGLETQWLLDPDHVDRPTIFRSFLRTLSESLAPPAD